MRPQAAIDNLTNHQIQRDMDGVFVEVSRQALDEVLKYLDTAGQNGTYILLDKWAGWKVRALAAEAKLSELSRGTNNGPY